MQLKFFAGFILICVGLSIMVFTGGCTVLLVFSSRFETIPLQMICFSLGLLSFKAGKSLIGSDNED